MDEKGIEALVNLLRDKDEGEIEQSLEALGISDDKREEVRRRLSELGSPLKGLLPEDLRKEEGFRLLVTLARRGKVILFVGAGLSVDAGMPSTGHLLDTIRAASRESGRDISPDTPFPKATGVLEDMVGRQDMVDVLRRRFDDALMCDPLPYCKGAYRLLTALPKQVTRKVVTTNWDSLLYRAFEYAREDSREISEEAQLTLIPLTDHAVVKLHGGFEHPERMVITDADYARALTEITRGTAGTLSGYVASLLAEYSFVFIGYSLKDPDFQLLQRMVQAGTGVQPAPHFLVAPLSRVDQEAVLRWAGVRPIVATASTFLLTLFQELDEFVNRQDELDLVFRRPSTPFVEFYGPFGSGKTALLDAVERTAQAEGWSASQIMRVNWGYRRDGTPRESIDSRTDILQVLNDDLEPSLLLKRFEDLGGYLRGRPGAFLILDATERVQNQKDLVSLLVDVVAPAIQEMNGPGRRCKLVLGGRYPLQGWPYSLRRNLLSHALTSFDTSVVREMAHKLLLITDADSQEHFEPELIADVLEVSSGHAGFLKAILLDLMSEERKHDGLIRLPRRLTVEDKREYVSRFNGDIDRHVPWENGTLKQVYEETLCVFRWLNREVVRDLALPFDPFSALTAIYVLSPDDYSNDQVIRRTKMFWLRHERPAEFMKAHQRAQEIFGLGVERLQYPLQLDYILEWLFHTAHLLIAEQPEDIAKRRARVFKQIRSVRFRADQEQVRGRMGHQLAGRISEQDRELWSLLEECVGKEAVEEVLTTLERKEVLDVG